MVQFSTNTHLNIVMLCNDAFPVELFYEQIFVEASEIIIKPPLPDETQQQYLTKA